MSLRSDGQALAWLDSAYQQQSDLVVADWNGTSVRNLRRIVTDPATPGGRGAASHIDADATSVAWAGRDVVMFVVEPGAATGTRVQPLDPSSSSRGWLTSGRRITPTDSGFGFYEGVITADASAALAVEAGPRWPDVRRTRAVRLDLATGKVLDVLATPDVGRTLLGVSGSEAGLVYSTGISSATGISDPRFYIRFAGDDHGRPLSGLPRDAVQVIAQP